MQKSQKSAAEPETKRDGVFRLVEKCGVIQLQFAKSVAERFVVGGVHGKKSGENHGLDGFKAGKGSGGAADFDDGVTDARVGNLFDIGDEEADISGGEFVEHDRFGRERAERFDFVNFFV